MQSTTRSRQDSNRYDRLNKWYIKGLFRQTVQRVHQSLSTLNTLYSTSYCSATTFSSYIANISSINTSLIPIISHLMKAASTKTRVKQSVTQEQATAQAVGFLHNTIQHGLATICHSRNIFPDSYFHNATTSQNETNFAIFRNDVDSLKSCSDSCNQRSSQDSIEKLHPTENPDLPLLSPLTQFDFTQTQAYSTNENENFDIQVTSIHHELTERQHAVMKAELKLLRHWLDGLYDILKQDESRSNLERIIFAIHHLPQDEGESESCESYSVS